MAGFKVDKNCEYNYMLMVSRMAKDKRAPYFFLKANDVLFQPKAKVEGKNLVTVIHDDEGKECSFLDRVDPGKEGYMIIAVPST